MYSNPPTQSKKNIEPRTQKPSTAPAIRRTNSEPPSSSKPVPLNSKQFLKEFTEQKEDQAHGEITHRTKENYIPKFGFHATRTSNLTGPKGIRQRGLDPDQGGGERGASEAAVAQGNSLGEMFKQDSQQKVHYTEDLNTAKIYSDHLKDADETQPTLLLGVRNTKASATEKDPQVQSKAYMTTEPIAPENITELDPRLLKGLSNGEDRFDLLDSDFNLRIKKLNRRNKIMLDEVKKILSDNPDLSETDPQSFANFSRYVANAEQTAGGSVTTEPYTPSDAEQVAEGSATAETALPANAEQTAVRRQQTERLEQNNQPKKRQGGIRKILSSCFGKR